jgi:hypothetical protein
MVENKAKTIRPRKLPYFHCMALRCVLADGHYNADSEAKTAKTTEKVFKSFLADSICDSYLY